MGHRGRGAASAGAAAKPRCRQEVLPCRQSSCGKESSLPRGTAPFHGDTRSCKA